MNKIYKYTKQNLPLLITVTAFVLTFTLLGIDGNTPFLSTRFFIRLFVVATLSCVLIFRKKVHADIVLKYASFLCIPFLTLIALFLLTLFPGTADAIAMEDRVIENISALGLIFGSACMFFCALVLFKKKYPFAALLSLLFCLVFFVIGMEEISWFQRLANIETIPVLSELNDQNENNLHNINTKWSEIIYYIGAFVMLTVVPFFRDICIKIIKKYKFTQNLTVLIPSEWLFLAFAVIVGFITAYTATNILYVTMYTFTIVALIYTYTINRKLNLSIALYSMLMILLIISTICAITNIDYLSGIRGWVGSEYREMFIGIGIGVYAFDTLLKSYSLKKFSHRSASRD